MDTEVYPELTSQRSSRAKITLSCGFGRCIYASSCQKGLSCVELRDTCSSDLRQPNLSQIAVRD